MSHANLSVVDIPDRSRFELLLDGERIGQAEYSIDGDVVTITHVRTELEHRGQGFAAVLMAGVVADVREHERRIRPLCSYAASYMREQTDAHDLVAS